MTNPRQYKIPDWFLNRQKDIVDGKYSQVKNTIFKFQLNVQKDKNNLNLIINMTNINEYCTKVLY